MMSTSGVAQLPGFEESLRLLIYREQYCLSDIALMFGVSRERIRQLCVLRGIEIKQHVPARGLAAVRLWDDETHRFRPVANADIERQRVRERQVKRETALAARVAARRAHLLATANGLRATLGRNPSWAEIWAAMGRAPNRGCEAILIGQWRDGRRQTTKASLADFLNALGWSPPDTRGQWVHKRLDDACRRGHPRTAANTYVQPDGYRQCRDCWKCRRRVTRATKRPERVPVPAVDCSWSSPPAVETSLTLSSETNQ